jgi:hypothetical protein
VLKREPTLLEASQAEHFVHEQAERIARTASPPQALPEPQPLGVPAPLGAALVDLCHALLNSAEFLNVE